MAGALTPLICPTGTATNASMCWFEHPERVSSQLTLH